MLEFIRKHANSLVVKIFLTILALTFVFCFGISDVIRKFTGKDYVVKVGDIKISPEMFKYEKAKRLHNLRDQSQNIDDSSITSHVLHDVIWDNVLGKSAEEFGLIVSDVSLQNYLVGMPMFRDQNGRFNPGVLRALLQQMHLNESAFLELLRKQVKMSLIQAPMQFISTAYENDAYIEAKLEKRIIDYIALSTDSFKVTDKASDEDLETFFADHQDDFVISERRSFTIVELQEDSVAKNIVISEEELRDAYEFSSDKEERSFEEMKEELEDSLRQEKLQATVDEMTRNIEDSLMAGDDIKSVAEKFQLKLVSIPNITVNDKAAVSNIAYGNDILTLGFTIDDGTDSSFSESLDKNGRRVLWLVHVDDITPQHVADMASVKDKIEKLWIKDRQHDLALEKARALAEQMDANTSLSKVAFNEKRKYSTSAAFDRNGMSDKGEASAIVADVCHDVFNQKIGDSAVREVNGQIYVYQVKNIVNVQEVSDEIRTKQTRTLHREFVDDLYQQLQNYLSKKYKVTVNYELLQASNEPVERFDEIF